MSKRTSGKRGGSPAVPQEGKAAQLPIDVSLSSSAALLDALDTGFIAYHLENPNDPTSLTLVTMNKASERSVHVSRDDVVGKKIEDAFPNVKDTGRVEIYAGVARSGKAADIGDVRQGDSPRGEIIYSARAIPLSSNCVGIIYTDVTEQRQAELRLRKSEERYRALFEHLGEGFALHEMIYDAEGKAVDYRFLAVNPAFEQLTGLKREDIVGRTVREVIPDTERFWIDTYGEVVWTGNPVRFERYFEPLGRHFEIFAFRPEEGKFAVLFLDITERKRVEAAAQEVADRLRIVADFTHDWEYWRDPNDRFLYVSPSCERVTGYSRDEFLSDPQLLLRIVHPDDREFVAAHLDEDQHNRDLCELEFRIIRRDGQERWIGHVCQAVLDSRGQSLGRRASNRDITDHKRAEKEIERLARFPAENPNPVLRIGIDGTILYTNAASQPLLEEWGLTSGGRARGPLLALAQEAVAKQSGTSGDIQQGEKVWAFVAAPIIDAGYVNLYGRDITVRRQAEAQLRLQATALEAAANGIVITNRNGEIEWVNDAFTRLTGYIAEEAIGQNPRVLKSGRHDEAFYRNLWETVLSGRVWSGELINKRKDGSLYTEEMTITPVLDSEGAIMNFIAIKQDVTKRKQAEAAVRHSERDLNRAQAVAHIGSWRMDVQLDVLEWSEESYRIFGVPPETPLTYEDFRACVHPDDREMVDQNWQAALAGAPYNIEHRIIVGDTVKWLHEQADLEFDEQGALRGGFGTCQDITKSKEAEEELKRALAAKDDFLSMVSHEMRTPLTAVLGNASLLLGPSSFEEERQSLLEDIREGAERLAGIINNMLALARFQTGRKIGLATISLGAAVEQLVSQHRMRYGPQRIQIRCVGEVPDVIGSKEYLSHILVNLMENAEKYTPHDEPIEVELRHEGKEVAVRVLDRGIGLTEEEAEHIFEPFYRSKRIADISPGVGIGLAVSKRLVEAQGGRIWALARDGGGSEFGFTLPVAP